MQDLNFWEENRNEAKKNKGKGAAAGHSSQEDALAALDLMSLKWHRGRAFGRDRMGAVAACSRTTSPVYFSGDPGSFSKLLRKYF